MAKQPWGGRPNRATLAKIKVGTIVASLVAFVGSLGAVAYLNPRAGNATAAVSAGQVTQVANLPSAGASTSGFSSSSSTSSGQQAPLVMPRVRTRAS